MTDVHHKRLAIAEKEARDFALERAAARGGSVGVGDALRIEGEGEAPRHEGEEPQQSEIGLIRQKLPHAMNGKQQDDRGQNHAGDIEDRLSLWAHALLLIHVFDRDRAAAIDFLRERGFHESVEIAVEHIGRRA